jgi:hypothetical protein
MVGDPPSGTRMILCVMNSWHENDASKKGAQTVVVRVDKHTVPSIQPLTSSLAAAEILGSRDTPTGPKSDSDSDPSASDAATPIYDLLTPTLHRQTATRSASASVSLNLPMRFLTTLTPTAFDAYLPHSLEPDLQLLDLYSACTRVVHMSSCRGLRRGGVQCREHQGPCLRRPSTRPPVDSICSHSWACMCCRSIRLFLQSITSLGPSA